MAEPYENIANAIILRAVTDYRAARKKLKHHPKNKDAKFIIEDCERFFRSDWFSALSGIDGPALLEKLKKEDIS